MENLVCKFGLVESVEALPGIRLPFPWKVADNGNLLCRMGPYAPRGKLTFRRNHRPRRKMQI